MLVLTNEEIAQILDMDQILDVLEKAFDDLSNQRAADMPRTEIFSPGSADNIEYVFKAMAGAYPRGKVTALRLNSDVIEFTDKKRKIPLAPGGRWVGLVLLFSSDTGTLLSIFPDGQLQHYRVGATNALAAKYLSRQDVDTYALIGSGQQATGQLMAMSRVRKLKKVRVYSKTNANAVKFAAEWSKKLDLDIEAVDSVEKAVKGAGIVGCATNSLKPVLPDELIKPGMFVTTVRHIELEGASFAKFDKIFINSKQVRPVKYEVKKEGPRPEMMKRDVEGRKDVDLGQYPEFRDLISGKYARRENDNEINCFVNNIGLGLQFAAVGTSIYAIAKAKGIGTELPDDWFSENMHP